jgi:hypothetical protein
LRDRLRDTLRDTLRNIFMGALGCTVLRGRSYARPAVNTPWPCAHACGVRPVPHERFSRRSNHRGGARQCDGTSDDSCVRRLADDGWQLRRHARGHDVHGWHDARLHLHRRALGLADLQQQRDGLRRLHVYGRRWLHADAGKRLHVDRSMLSSERSSDGVWIAPGRRHHLQRSVQRELRLLDGLLRNASRRISRVHRVALVFDARRVHRSSGAVVRVRRRLLPGPVERLPVGVCQRNERPRGVQYALRGQQRVFEQLLPREVGRTQNVPPDLRVSVALRFPRTHPASHIPMKHTGCDDAHA